MKMNRSANLGHCCFTAAYSSTPDMSGICRSHSTTSKVRSWLKQRKASRAPSLVSISWCVLSMRWNALSNNASSSIASTRRRWIALSEATLRVLTCGTPMAAGKRTRKSAPRPGSLSADRSPPARRTMSREMGKPRPVPRSGGLVVKKDSKMRGKISGGMPGPLSSISTMTLSPSSRLRT